MMNRQRHYSTSTVFTVLILILEILGLMFLCSQGELVISSSWVAVSSSIVGTHAASCYLVIRTLTFTFANELSWIFSVIKHIFCLSERSFCLGYVRCNISR